VTWVGNAPFIDVIRLDINPDVRSECLDWIDTVWLPRVAGDRAATSASRYRCISGEPRELIFLGSMHARGEEPIATLPKGNPLIERWTRNYESATFRQIFSQGSAVPGNTYINAITTRVRSADAHRFSDWYSTVHMPEILECPGWECGRRYERTDRGSEFLAIYQVADPDTPFHSAQYERAVGWDGYDEVMLGFHGFRIFVLEREFPGASGPPEQG
jgi:hypothetical protein